MNRECDGVAYSLEVVSEEVDDGPGGKGGVLRTYEVRGPRGVVGYIEAKRFRSSGTYKGTRIRRDFGFPKRWGWSRERHGRRRPLYDSIRLALSALVGSS